MGWAAALMFTAPGFGALCIVLIWACSHFDEQKREERMLRKRQFLQLQLLRMVKTILLWFSLLRDLDLTHLWLAHKLRVSRYLEQQVFI